MSRFFVCVRACFGILAFVFVASTFAANLAVAVSLQPYANIVKNVAGDRVDVITLLPPGADPHTFEPKPATLKAFSKVNVYFSDGSGMDKAWMPRFKGVNKNVQVVELSKNMQWMEGENHHHGEEHEADEANEHTSELAHEHHHELDPHIWTSPKRVLLIAQNVCDALIALDSAGKDVYTAQLAKFKERLETLDKELQEAIAKLPVDRRTFIVFHPSYGYFAIDYGMKQLSIEVNGKEPKPKDLANLIEEGREHGVHIVFVQPQFSKRAAGTIAKELNAVVVTTDPLAYDFAENVRTLIKAIAQAAQK